EPLVRVDGLRDGAPHVEVQDVGLPEVRQGKELRNCVESAWMEPGLREDVVRERLACHRVVDDDRRAEDPSSRPIDRGRQERRKVAFAELREGPEGGGDALPELAAPLVVEGPKGPVADDGAADESSKLVAA